MSDVPTGYVLTVLAYELGLYPSGVKGTAEDGFRYTDPETGYSIEWEPHRNVQQARTVFWDLLPKDKCAVTLLRLKTSIGGYAMVSLISLTDSVRDDSYTYWGRDTGRSEAEALLCAACLAVQALRRL